MSWDYLEYPFSNIRAGGLLMPDSAVGCRGDFPSELAFPTSPVQYLELSTKLSP